MYGFSAHEIKFILIGSSFLRTAFFGVLCIFGPFKVFGRVASDLAFIRVKDVAGQGTNNVCTYRTKVAVDVV